jgi:hypothetical protein
MVTANVPKEAASRYRPAREAAEAYFIREGISHERMESAINFANVEFVPEADLLVVADATQDPITPSEEAELRRVFGNPANIIHLALSPLHNRAGSDLCYDMDLAFHAMRNERGDKIALIHKPCIRESGGGSVMSRSQVLKALGTLGFKVIDIGSDDQAALAANALSLDTQPGRLLLPSSSISDKLRTQLQENGITTSFSRDGKVLGHKGTDAIPPYGIHCLTVSLRLPESPAGRGPQKTDL